MKKWKFALTSLLGITVLPITTIVSCNPAEGHYKWSINKGNFTYELVSDVIEEDFKIKIVATGAYAIDTLNSKYTIDGQEHSITLHEGGLLVIPKDEINGKKIEINIATAGIPANISISYGEGKTEDVHLFENQTLTFNMVVEPAEFQDSVELVVENKNIASFEDNVLTAHRAGDIDVYAKYAGYGIEKISNKIHVYVDPTPDADEIDDTNVPDSVNNVNGADKIGFLFRGFKADFNARERWVIPSIVWPSQENVDPTISMVNLENDSFSKTKFDVYVEFPSDQYDKVDHTFQVKFSFYDEKSDPILSKPLKMKYNATSKAIDTSDVDKSVTLASMSDVYVNGFKANFKVDNGYDLITFYTLENDVEIKSFELCDVVYSGGISTFNVHLFIESDFQNEPFPILIYLNNTFVSKLDLELISGDWITCDSECEFINADNPYCLVREFTTNFDFRIDGEISEKPLLTIEWKPFEGFPTPSSTTIIRRSSSTEGKYKFNVNFEWNQKIDVSKYDTHYFVSAIAKKDNVVVTNSEILFSMSLPTIRPYDLNTDLVVKPDETLVELHDFMVCGDYCDDFSKKVGIKFKSNDGIPAPTSIKRILEWHDTGKIIFDGVFVETLGLEWDQPLELTATPKSFSITLIDKNTQEAITQELNFTIHAPIDNDYWQIRTSGENAKLTCIENTEDEIKFAISDVKAGYEFVGFSLKQHCFTSSLGITLDLDNNIITVDTTQAMQTEDEYLFVNCQLDAMVIYKNSSDTSHQVVLNNETEILYVDEKIQAIKNETPIDVKNNEEYYIHIDTKNWFIKQEEVEGMTFISGNIIDNDIMQTDYTELDIDKTLILCNGIAKTVEFSSNNVFNFYSMHLDMSTEDFKNNSWDIIAYAVEDKLASDFNVFLF